MIHKFKKMKKQVYLDNAAATPLDARVKKIMEPYWEKEFGNPSAIYKQGRGAKTVVDESRKKIAQIINAKPSEIIFTAGGTESVNLAIFGAARSACCNFKKGKVPHLITTSVEHNCVINSFKALADAEEFNTTYVQVNSDGFIDFEKLKQSVRPETVLLSVMLANNEIGTIQPIAKIGKWLKILNSDRKVRGLPKIIFHTDACQAAGYLDLNVEKLGVDLMSVNGSKIYGPKQAGFLYVRLGVKLQPLIYGGGQEKGLRSGTENVPGIVGLSSAFEFVQKNKEKESKRLIFLRDYLIKELRSKITGVLLNGPDSTVLKDYNRLPNNVNFTITGVEGETLIIYLDSYKIAASTSSACNTVVGDPSHVLLAIGRTVNQAKSSVRFTLGKMNTKTELDYLIDIMPSLVESLRKVNS